MSDIKNIEALIYALNDVKSFFNEIYETIREIIDGDLKTADMWKRVERKKIENIVNFFTWLWEDSVEELRIEADYEVIIEKLSEKIYMINNIKKWIDETLKKLEKIKKDPSIVNNPFEFWLISTFIEQEINNIVNFFNWINYEFLRKKLSNAYTLWKLEKNIIKINWEIGINWEFAIVVDWFLWPYLIIIYPDHWFKVFNLFLPPSVKFEWPHIFWDWHVC